MNQLFDPAHPITFWASVTTAAMLAAHLGIPALAAGVRSTGQSLQALLVLTHKSFAPVSYVRKLRTKDTLRIQRAFRANMPDWVNYKPRTGDVWQNKETNNYLTIWRTDPDNEAYWHYSDSDHTPTTDPAGRVRGFPNTLREILSNGWTRKV